MLDKDVDRLFKQIIDRIGTIEKLEVKAPKRQSEIDTVCYVSLVNRQKHATLIYLLNNHVFHGRNNHESFKLIGSKLTEELNVLITYAAGMTINVRPYKT